MARRGTTAHIDIAELEKLCAIQATDEEIAAWLASRERRSSVAARSRSSRKLWSAAKPRAGFPCAECK